LLGGVVVSGVGAALALSSCGEDHHADHAETGDVDNEPFDYLPPSTMPTAGVQQYLTKDEASLLDALMSRILPGTAADPGAHESGAVLFVDAMLAEFASFDEPTYQLGPFVGDPASANQLPQGVDKLSDDDLQRYGFQGKMPPQETYRNGLAQLADYAQQQLGVPFTAATAAQQDQIVGALADGSAPFDKPKAKDFFKRVRTDTIHAVFSDPMYGGNRDMIGWKLVGYPGAQRVWTPIELKQGPDPSRQYQGLMELHRSHPGRPGPDNVIRPVQEPNPKVHP
jgi:gluconate 2-dehydrogenase gamma chain